MFLNFLTFFFQKGCAGKLLQSSNVQFKQVCAARGLEAFSGFSEAFSSSLSELYKGRGPERKKESERSREGERKKLAQSHLEGTEKVFFFLF